MLWSLRIFAKYSEHGLKEPLGFDAYHGVVYGPMGVDVIPEDSLDGKLLGSYGWRVQDDTWAWTT